MKPQRQSVISDKNTGARSPSPLVEGQGLGAERECLQLSIVIFSRRPECDCKLLENSIIQLALVMPGG